MVSVYAILDAEGRCINRVLWDSKAPWQPPKGCIAIEDPDNLYPIITGTPELITEEINTEDESAADLTQLEDTSNAS